MSKANRSLRSTIGLWSLGTLLAWALGCGSLQTHHVLTGQAGAPYPGDVRIVLDGAAQPPGLQEVAIIQAVGTGAHANLQDLVAGLKTEAQSLGCDTVVNVHVDQGDSTASASGVAARTVGSPPQPAAAPAPQSAPAAARGL
jgi:hypothetical protein